MKILFETDRLFVCRLNMDDLSLLFEVGQDPEVMRYIHGGKILSWEEEKKRLEERLEYYEKQPGLGVFKLIDKASGEFIGNCNINHLDTTDKIQIGYRLAKKHWGKGFATEIARALITYGFDKLKLETIYAVTEPGNESSGHVLEKAGLIRKGEATYFNRSLHFFALKKEEYIHSLLKNTP